jgi:hypothetical protein
MKSPMVRLAVAFTVLYTVLLIATSQVDIDYSHSVVGTGTIITDYHMEAEQATEASGKVRGTGNVMNKYLFLSENNSQNLTIEDQFSLSGNFTNSTVIPSELDFGSFPPLPHNPGAFRLTGAAWADRLVVPITGTVHLGTQALS